MTQEESAQAQQELFRKLCNKELTFNEYIAETLKIPNAKKKYSDWRDEKVNPRDI